MSRMREELTAQRPAWGPFPHELEEAWLWMEEQGFGRHTPAGYVLTPYAGDRVLGPVFTPSLSLEGWFGSGTHGSARLLPIAEAGGDGSILALWLDDDGETRVVVLASDGEGYIAAQDARDFLVLLAIGYTEFFSLLIYGPPEDEEAVEALADFRTWVEERYAVEVPEEWPPVGDDEFTAWLEAQLGHDTAAENSAPSHGQSAEVAGDVASLLAVLGEKDGPEAASSVADTVGIELGDSLRASTKLLRSAGIEVKSDRHGVATIWITVADYPRPANLFDGVDASTGLEAARAVFGEPEVENAEMGWIRYIAAGRFVHLTFDDGLSLVTLMVDAP